MNDSNPGGPVAATPVVTAAESSPRNGVMRLYAVLFGLLLTLFSVLISGDCYFNFSTFCVSIALFVASALVCAIKWFQVLRRNGYLVPDKKGVRRRLHPVEVPLVAGLVGLAFGGWLWVCLFAVLNLAVFIGAQRTEQTTSVLEVSYWDEGRCRVDYAFFDPTIQRRVSNCGLPYSGASSGDEVTVKKLAGPLGMRLLSIRPKHRSS